MIRLLPGTVEHSPAVVRRRTTFGLLVILVAVALQTLPGLTRSMDVVAHSSRFVYWFVEMLAVSVVASRVYNVCLEKRAGSALTVASTMAASAVIGVIFVTIFRLLAQKFPWLSLRGDPKFDLLHVLALGVFLGVLHGGLWGLAFVYPHLIEDARVRAVESDKLRLEAEQLRTAAELSRLRMQLEPHFLLNTLNAIAGLVTEEPREARRLLACLGDLLRDSLRDAEEMQTLDDEVAWLRRYAEILEARHSGALRFQWEIDESAAFALVPRLLLQPLVENAVKHGALRRREGGLVTVKASVLDTDGHKRVCCAIEDNGPGVTEAEPRPGAFGLRSVRRRLELRFPDASLTIESSGKGTRSVVNLPCQTSGEA